jgi:two-component system nitrate/nitrite response regulator NarL
MGRSGGATHFGEKRGISLLALVPKSKAERPRARMQIIPTVIVDRSALFRAGLVHTLIDTRFKVTAQCARLDELDRHAFQSRESLALISLDAPTQEIGSYISNLRKHFDKLRVILLNEKFDDRELNSVIALGADSYMLKGEITLDSLLWSLELVMSGGKVFPHAFMEKLRREWTNRSKTEVTYFHSSDLTEEARDVLPTIGQMQSDVRLSNREKAILRGLMEGASNKLIARELDIAEATVKVHVKSVLRKIRVKNRTQAAMWACSHSGSGDTQHSLSSPAAAGV